MATTERAMDAHEEHGDDLIDIYIDVSSRRPDPGDARLTGYGYPVWIMIDALDAAEHDLARVAREYELPEDAVRAAVVFSRRHREAIDARARANAAAFGAFASRA